MAHGDSKAGWGARFALAALGFAIPLAIAELWLRAAPNVSAEEGFRTLFELRPDREWIYGMRAGAVVRVEGDDGTVEYAINDASFRGNGPLEPKPSGVQRWVVVGDSVTFGYGVDAAHTFVRALEDGLAASSPASEVLNLGVGGYNTYTESALFEDIGAALEPDVVLLQFCVNDLVDPTLHFDAQTRQHLGAIPDAAYPDPSVRVRPQDETETKWLALCRRSRVCGLVDEALRRFRPNDLGDAALMQSLRTPNALPGSPIDAWFAANVGRVQRASEALGARFALVVFPAEPHLEALARGEEVSLGRDLEALGQRSGWRTIDLFPAFEAKAAEGDDLFLDLWHPTPRGHSVAAEAILDAMVAWSWIEGPDLGSGAEPAS